MQEDRKELHRRICVNIGLALAFILFVIFVLPHILRFFAPLIVAWVVAMIANPVIRFLEKRIKIMRKHGTALMIVLVLLAVCALIYGLCAVTFNQISSLLKELPGIYASVTENIQEVFQSLHARWHIIPADIHEVFSDRETAANDYIMTALNGMMDSLNKGAFSKMGSVASSVADFIVYTVLTILASYFMTVEKDNISRALREKMPLEVESFWCRVKDICRQAIGGYFKAHFQIMVVIFFITVIPFAIMGISYSSLLAVLIAVVDFLPFFGAGTILIPWAVYELITGSYRYAVILFVLYFVIMVVRQLLEPKLIGDSIGISSFEILIFMLIGYRLCGMLGLILSIPAGMVVMACYREGMFDSYIRGIKILVQDINEYRKY